MAQDLFQAPDYYLLDELLRKNTILFRDSPREWVKREVSPIIEEYAQKAMFQLKYLVFGRNRCFLSLYTEKVRWRWVRSNFIWFNYAGN